MKRVCETSSIVPHTRLKRYNTCLPAQSRFVCRKVNGNPINLELLDASKLHPRFGVKWFESNVNKEAEQTTMNINGGLSDISSRVQRYGINISNSENILADEYSPRSHMSSTQQSSVFCNNQCPKDVKLRLHIEGKPLEGVSNPGSALLLWLNAQSLNPIEYNYCIKTAVWLHSRFKIPIFALATMEKRIARIGSLSYQLHISYLFELKKMLKELLIPVFVVYAKSRELVSLFANLSRSGNVQTIVRDDQLGMEPMQTLKGIFRATSCTVYSVDNSFVLPIRNLPHKISRRAHMNMFLKQVELISQRVFEIPSIDFSKQSEFCQGIEASPIAKILNKYDSIDLAETECGHAIRGSARDSKALSREESDKILNSFISHLLHNLCETNICDRIYDLLISRKISPIYLINKLANYKVAFDCSLLNWLYMRERRIFEAYLQIQSIKTEKDKQLTSSMKTTFKSQSNNQKLPFWASILPDKIYHRVNSLTILRDSNFTTILPRDIENGSTNISRFNEVQKQFALSGVISLKDLGYWFQKVLFFSPADSCLGLTLAIHLITEFVPDAYLCEVLDVASEHHSSRTKFSTMDMHK